MLHLTTITLVCCVVSAPGEGIAVIRRKNYLFDGLRLFDRKVPKVTEVSSSSIYRLDDEQFLDCLKHKIIYKPSFFYNLFINQYQSKKNNYCIIMDSVLEKAKEKSDLSVELTYRKRNLLWTQKGISSLKTLKPINETPTTSKPIQKFNLNFKERKRLLALKKAKALKRIRVRRYTRRRHFFGKPRDEREQYSYSGSARELSKAARNGYLEKKMRRGQLFPGLLKPNSFIESKYERDIHVNTAFKKTGRKSAIEKASRVGLNSLDFRHSRSFTSNQRAENSGSTGAKHSKINYLPKSNFKGVSEFFRPNLNDRKEHKNRRLRTKVHGFRTFQTQLEALPLMKNQIETLRQDSGLKDTEESNLEDYLKLSSTTQIVSSSECEDNEKAKNFNKKRTNGFDNELHFSRSNLDTKSRISDDLTSIQERKAKQEMNTFLREILTKNHFTDLNEDFNAMEGSHDFLATDKKPFLAYTRAKKKVPIVDFDFPDYDEIYDTATDFFTRDHTPFLLPKRHNLKSWRSTLPGKKYPKIREQLRSDLSRIIPVYFRRSLLLEKNARKKKCCRSRCCGGCGTPHKCWKAAPLLCIPYIRKGQDDLLKYLIQVMQKMLGKPYPQKIDIFENIKYKPCLKKAPSGTCEDILPHEPDDDEDDDSCDSNKHNTSSQPCNPCPGPCPKLPEPCPAACPPTPTPCSPSKSCSKNSSEPSCPSFPFSLPNLNQIYTEPTLCSSDKCFSTLPSFMLSPSSILQSGAPKFSSKPDPVSSSLKPTQSAATTISSVSPKVKIGQPSESPESIFAPKSIYPEYFKKAKQIKSDIYAGKDQLRSDEQLNDKVLPELFGNQEEMKILNLTESTSQSESTLIPSMSNKPFLFELPELYNDKKYLSGFPNISNSFVRRDLNDVYKYGSKLFHLKIPAHDLSPINQKSHHKPLEKGHRKKKHFDKILSTTEADNSRNTSEVLLQRYDESQIEKPFSSRHRARKFVKSKNSKSLGRRKREDDYNLDDLVNYDSYLYGTNHNEESYEKQPFYQLKKEEINTAVNGLADDYIWTPLKFEMFSELAKLITEKEDNKSSVENVPTSPYPTSINSTVNLSVESQLETTSITVSTEKNSISTASKKPSTNPISTSSSVTQQSKASADSTETTVRNETPGSERSSTTAGFQSMFRANEEKSLEANTYPDGAEDGQIPTTLGTASIVKGPKKQMTKPSPKIYTKIYPDSVVVDVKKNDTKLLVTTDAAPKRSILLKITPATTSATSNVRLQLLAVCEGYLEAVKFMKSHNQSLGEDLDSDLSRYCENIISQSFSQQTELSKSKKHELSSSGTGETENFQNAPKRVEKPLDSLRLNDPVLQRKLEKNAKFENKNLKTTNDEGDEISEPSGWENKQNVKKGQRKKKEYQRTNQRQSGTDDEFLKKGMTKEQMELLRLLKKRKRALLHWLFNSKEGQIQPEVEETEYFDDDDDASLGDSLNFRNGSGTIRPRGAKSSRTTEKVVSTSMKDSVFPVYAKQYGYDKGGELRQVEVLWRKVNEKTHEKKIFKNMSVLALVATSALAPRTKEGNNNFVGTNRNVDRDIFDGRPKNEVKVGFGKLAPDLQDNNSFVTENATTVAETSFRSNNIVTYVNKPNPSSLIGTEIILSNNTKATKRPNITRKLADKLNKAQGVVEEYTVGFWNYAAYILPIMSSVLFLFCCACFAIYISNKKKKRKKKKKKKIESTDEESSTEETDSEPKKRKRDKSENSKKIWNVWKKNSNNTGSGDEANSPKKKKSILRFLKSKKGDKAEEDSSVPYTALPESDEAKGDTQSEAAERRELITLLEELKKIEMEQVGEKKEQKSVHVQYMIQDPGESAFKPPEMQKTYPFYNKNFSFYDHGSEEYGIYTDEELNELLPCECNYYNKKRDYLRNCNFRAKEGQCDKLFKIFRNTSMCHHKLANTKQFTDKDRNFIFEKYRSTGTKDGANKMSFTNKGCEMTPFNLSTRNPNDWVGEVEHFNHQIMKKKHIRLKDDGVLCRL